MPPAQIKSDINRSGWEATDFPSVCENCLPENPYVRMLKEDYGAECKLSVRDAALKMVAPGPTSEINREYFAQNNSEAIEKGLIGTEEYEKTDDKARELLQRLAQSKPYFRKGRQVDEEGKPVANADHANTQKRLGASSSNGLRDPSATGGDAAVGAGLGGAGPIRTRDSRAARAAG
ncbi:Pre-mRNA-splicing factor slt11, partial [Sporothrix bragantina]